MKLKAPLPLAMGVRYNPSRRICGGAPVPVRVPLTTSCPPEISAVVTVISALAALASPSALVSPRREYRKAARMVVVMAVGTGCYSSRLRTY